MASPQKVLAGNPFSKPSFTYPIDLGSIGQEPYIIFAIYDSVAKSAQEKGTIALYMPPSIKVSYNANYENLEMSIDQLASFTTMLTSSNKSLLEIGKSAGLAGTAAVIDKISSSNAQAYNERYNGRIVNPHMAVLFKGIEPRTFTFDFNMFAKNAKESEQIVNIIRVFKYALHPSVKDATDNVSKRFFYYPENFVISLHSPATEYLFKITTCALVSMEVDYAGQGNVVSFFSETGAPVSVSMSLTFKEQEILTKERIAEGY